MSASESWGFVLAVLLLGAVSDLDTCIVPEAEDEFLGLAMDKGLRVKRVKQVLNLVLLFEPFYVRKQGAATPAYGEARKPAAAAGYYTLWCIYTRLIFKTLLSATLYKEALSKGKIFFIQCLLYPHYETTGAAGVYPLPLPYIKRTQPAIVAKR